MAMVVVGAVAIADFTYLHYRDDETGAAQAFSPTTPAQIRGATASDCHPSYAGVCVPAGVLDVDCASSGGDGPFYVSGPVRVVGRDVYGLDADQDGVACEPLRP
jgi:hypothetical protein